MCVCVCMYMHLYIYIFNQPLSTSRMQHKVKFRWSLAVLNSVFSFSLTSCHTKVNELSLPYYLPIAGRRIIGFIRFLRVLALCERQTINDLNLCHHAHFL